MAFSCPKLLNLVGAAAAAKFHGNKPQLRPRSSCWAPVGLAQTLRPTPSAAGTRLLFADAVISQNYTVTRISIAGQAKKKWSFWNVELVALKLKTFHKHMPHINYLSIHLPERNEDPYLYKVCAHIHGGLLSDGPQTGSCPTLHRQVTG